MTIQVKRRTEIPDNLGRKMEYGRGRGSHAVICASQVDLAEMKDEMADSDATETCTYAQISLNGS